MTSDLQYQLSAITKADPKQKVPLRVVEGGLFLPKPESDFQTLRKYS
jgi:hypothetical protein